MNEKMSDACMNESRDSLDHFFEVQTEPLVFFVQQNKGNFYVSLKLSKSCCVTSLSFLSLSLSLLSIFYMSFSLFSLFPFSLSLSLSLSRALSFLYFLLTFLYLSFLCLSLPLSLLFTSMHNREKQTVNLAITLFSLSFRLLMPSHFIFLSLSHSLLFSLLLRLCPIIYDGILKKYRVAHKSEEGGEGKTFFVIKTELSKVFHVSPVKTKIIFELLMLKLIFIKWSLCFGVGIQSSY